MTRQPLTRAPHMTLTENGALQVRLRAASLPAGTVEVGLVLDGVLHGVAPLSQGPRGWRQLHFSLPAHRLFAALDLVGMADGDSLIGLALPLAPLYGLEFGPLRREGARLVGDFSGAAWLGAQLGVELMEGEAVLARGVARRPPDAAAWEVSLHMANLPRPGQLCMGTPRVGGLRLEGPVTPLSAADIGYVGCLDAASPHHVEGWAVNLRDPGQRVALEVLVNAQSVGFVTAAAEREDLRKLGLGDGFAGFSLELPPHPEKTAPRSIAVRLAGSLTQLTNSPLTISPVAGLTGHFDSLHGMCAHGWALDHRHPEVPVQIEVLGPDGAVLAVGAANQFRGDLLDAGLNKGICAFKIDLSAHFERLLNREITVRVAGTPHLLAGSPQRATLNPNLLKFVRRKQLPDGVLPRLKRALNHRAGADGVSFIMPVHETPRAWLVEALESVRTQFCDRWELICVNDGSKAPHVGQVLASYAARDPRFKVLTSAQNVGIARAINFGLRVARYGLVAFMDHDDTLEPDAAWQLIRAARETEAELLYSDEAQTDENINAITEFRLRPAFSHDYYLSHPYFVHMVCVRTDLARRLGGWDESMAISADVDFVLRAIEAAHIVAHVPAVLYRWRTHGASAGHSKQAAVMQATIGALQRHLDRLRTGARVSEGVWFNQFRVDWPSSDGLILIVMPTKNGLALLRKAVSSIEATSKGIKYRLVIIDHESDDPATRAYLAQISGRHVVMPYAGAFNFARMNNQAVARHGADATFVLFVNNDIEAVQNGWLDRLRALAYRRDVGAVGPLLMYADRHVQHAGVILGFNDSAEHALKFQPVYLDDKGRRNLGYNCTLTSVRDYSAVTAACLMMRRAVFDEVGGFDETFQIGFNDTDLCLRIGARGYRILYDGATMLYHYESATRSQTQQVFHPEDTNLMVARWGAALRAGDRFYHPNLSLRTQDHVAREAPGCRVHYAPRTTKLDLSRLASQPVSGR